METEGNVEVPSVLVVPSLKEVDTKTVTNELLERILSTEKGRIIKKIKQNKEKVRKETKATKRTSK